MGCFSARRNALLLFSLNLLLLVLITFGERLLFLKEVIAGVIVLHLNTSYILLKRKWGLV